MGVLTNFETIKKLLNRYNINVNKIFILFTFANSKSKIKALHLLKKSGFSNNKWFELNNSPFIRKHKKNEVLRKSQERHWDRGIKAFKNLFTELDKIPKDQKSETDNSPGNDS